MTVRMLGRAEVVLEGAPVSFRSNKALEILGFIVSRGTDGAPRKLIAEALWPMLEPERQRHNLRQNLVYLRQAGVSLIERESDILALPQGAKVDVWDFVCEESDLESYQGPFMAQVSSDWVQAPRERLSQLYIHRLLGSCSDLLQQDPSASVACAEKAIEEDPLQEAAWYAKVQALIQLGESGKAVQAVEKYRALLSRELGLDASPKLLGAVGLEPGVKSKARKFSRTLLSPLQLLQYETARMPDYLLSGRLSEGRRRISEALTKVKPGGEEQSRALSALSRLDYEAGEYDSALRNATLALEDAGSPRSRSIAQTHLARARIGLGQYEVADKLLRGILSKLPKRDLELRSEVLQLASLAAYFHHRADEALALALRGLKLAEEADWPFLQLGNLNAAGSSLFKLGRIDESVEYQRRALHIAEAVGMPMRIAHLSSTIGRVMEAQGRLDEARELYVKSYEAFDNGESLTFLPMVATYLGNLDLKTGNPRKALEWHKKAFALRRTAGERLGLATSLRGIGQAYLAMEMYPEAIEMLRRSQQAYESMNDDFGAAIAQVPLVEAYYRSGSKQQALHLLDKAEEVMKSYATRVSTAFEDESLSLAAVEQLRARIEQG